MNEIYNTLPLIIMSSLIIVNILLAALIKKSQNIIFSVSTIGTIIIAIVSFLSIDKVSINFSNSLHSGGITNLFIGLFSIILFLILLSSKNFIDNLKINFSEYYLLLITSSFGMMVMASSRDLMVTFIGLEIMSISFYVLAGFDRHNLLNNEASIKYFLLGAFTSGIFLYGIAMIYGAAKTTNLIVITKSFPVLLNNPFFILGLFFLIIGLSFKVAAVPFHMWAPDVYEGSPTTSTAIMATGGKAAALISFIVSFAGASVQISSFSKLSFIISIISALSMLVGSILALYQKNFKRMLAYSGIANAGYMLIGIASANYSGFSSITFYLFVYSLINIGVFAIISIMEKNLDKSIMIEDLKGFYVNNKYLSALMAIFMFSLGGIPPFGSFFGKYYIFISSIQSNIVWLALVGVISSVISIYIYLRITILMFFYQDNPQQKINYSLSENFVFIFCSLVTIQMGLSPQFLSGIILKYIQF